MYKNARKTSWRASIYCPECWVFSVVCERRTRRGPTDDCFVPLYCTFLFFVFLWKVKDAVMRCPSLLSLSERGPHAVASWLQGGLGLSGDDVGKMVRRNPAIVGYSIVHTLRPKLRQAFSFISTTVPGIFM